MNESGEGEELGLGSDETIRRIGERWSGRNQKESVGEDNNKEGISEDCG